MSDYINIKDDRLWNILFDEACVEGKQAERIQKELEQIAVDEKEIIRKAFERVLDKLRDRMTEYSDGTFHLKEFDTMAEAIEIVKEECGISE